MAMRKTGAQEWQEEMDPAQPPTLEEEPLAGVKLEARAYWVRFLPRSVRAQKKEGPERLDRATRKAYWERRFLVKLERARSPKLPLRLAEKIYRDVLFPPPERLTMREPRRRSRPTV